MVTHQHTSSPGWVSQGLLGMDLFLHAKGKVQELCVLTKSPGRRYPVGTMERRPFWSLQEEMFPHCLSLNAGAKPLPYCYHDSCPMADQGSTGTRSLWEEHSL